MYQTIEPEPVMTYTHTKVQSQWSVGSKDTAETKGGTDEQTDAGDCITSHANAVSKDHSMYVVSLLWYKFTVTIH